MSIATHVFSALLCLTLVVGVVELLRRRLLKEKYAVLWLTVTAFTVTLVAWPRLLTKVANTLGFETPSNLLFLSALMLLLAVAIHLSWECSRLEDRVRSLAENQALLLHAVEQSRAAVPPHVPAQVSRAGAQQSSGEPQLNSTDSGGSGDPWPQVE